MSRELEVFKDLMQSVIPETTCYSDWRKDYNYMIKILTPPTEEEVCKALSEYVGKDVVYNPKGNKLFAIHITGNTYKYITHYYSKPKISINLNVDIENMHLITLIGRFYQHIHDKESE